MRVAVVIPLRWDASSFSVDPTLLAEGFAAQGEDAVICCEPGSSYDTDIPVIELRADEMHDSRTWARLGVELAIVFTWMTNHNDVLRALRAADAFAVSKGDTDGLLVARVHPAATLMRSVFIPVGAVGTARNVWFWAKKWAYIYRQELDLIVRNIEVADLTVVETEPARDHVRRILAYAGREDLADKLECVGNPVPESFGAHAGESRDRSVVSVGRWDDPAKNARLLSRTLQAYGRRDASARFLVVGTASERVRLAGPQMTSVGRVGRDELAGFLSTARVCLITSRWESFHNAGHEALASGCTIVGTPIGAVRSMIGDGSFGAAASGNAPDDLVQALEEEMDRWDRAQRDPVAIAAHWHGTLRPEAIARRYLALRAPRPGRAS